MLLTMAMSTITQACISYHKNKVYFNLDTILTDIALVISFQENMHAYFYFYKSGRDNWKLNIKMIGKYENQYW